MYNRIKSLLILIVCVLSNFFVYHTVYAHPDEADIRRAETTLDNGIRYMGITVSNYGQLRGQMVTLIGEWNSNKNAVKNKTNAALTKGSIAIVSAAAAAISGGTLAPAAYLASLAAYDALQAGTINSQKYVDAMGKVLSLMDAALIDVNTAYSMGGTLVLPATNTDGTLTGGTMSVNVKGYVNNYKAYLSAGATHLPGETYESLYPKVQQNAGSVDSHTFLVMKTYKHYPHENVTTQYHDWKPFGLPNDHECDGPCSDMFRSPHEAFTAHRTKCGTGISIDIEILVAYPGADDLTILAQIGDRLKKRSVNQGCGRSYYKCPSRLDHRDAQKHEELTCNKWVWEKPSGYLNAFKSYQCGRKFRKCMGHTFDHNPDVWWATAHSDMVDTDDSNDADDSSNYEDPSNPDPPSTPSYHTCGSHETWQSGDHFAAGCDTSGHYVCDGSDHSYTYCYVTDANGNTCTVGGYYACQSHMHQYPEPQSQYMTCAYGHTYDTTVQSQVDFHRTKTCKWCGGTWKDCGDVTPYCPTWTTAHHKCSEPSHTCDLCD